LLGLSSPAEREQIEANYFENADAFQEMLAAEDDLIDAYACGELTGEERRSFEKNFAGSFSGRDRVQFARGFANVISATQPVNTNLPKTRLNIFQLPRLLRTAPIAAVIVFVAALAWLVSDRWRMTNELRELRAESAELSKRTEELQRRSDTEQTRTTELAAQLAGLQAQPVKPQHSGRRLTREVHVGWNYTDIIVRGTAKDPQGNVVSGAIVTLTDSARTFTRTQSTNKDGAYVFNAIPPGTYSVEIKAQGFKTAIVPGLNAVVGTPTALDVQLEVGAISDTVAVTSSAQILINREDASLGNTFVSKKITQLPLEVRNVPHLLSLQTGATRDGYVAGTRADQSNITLDGVDLAPPDTYFLVPPNANGSSETNLRIPNSLSWIRFQITLEQVAIHEDYTFIIKTADGRYVTTVSWIEPLTPDQTIIDTPLIQTADLPSGDYVLLLMGKEPDGSFVKVTEHSLKIIRY